MSDDEADHVVGHAPRGAVVVVVIASVVVMAAFLFALGTASPREGVHVVVVADGNAHVGEASPVRVLGLHRQRLVPVDVVVNGAAVDGDGFGVVDVGAARRLRVKGTARIADDDARPIDLEIPLPTPTTPTLTTSPWTTALAMPVSGAAVFPEGGLVPSRGVSRVVLVDDHGVEVVDVDAGTDARLPDGRLLAVDRLPVSWHLDDDAHGDIVVVVTAREATKAVVTVFVGDRVTYQRRLDLVVGETRFTAAVPTSSKPGDLVVISLATSLLPSAPTRQLITRVGGVRDDDLLRVEPRAAGHLDDVVVRQALSRRLVVSAAVPTTVSPSSMQQEQALRRRDRADAARARAVFRGAALVQVVCLIVMALAARPRFITAVLAVSLVVAFDVGLDAVLGVPDDDDSATSGSP